MKIVADENIARVEEFRSLGDLHLLPGREIKQNILHDADALLIRSVTKINAELLKDSSVKFIASATSGFDHVDTNFLSSKNIHFNHAPACNARSVVEYVFSAMAFLSQTRGFDWRNRSFGIIGAGNIGGLLARYLRVLEIDVKIYDPYLNAQSEHGDKLSSFTEVLKQDVLSIHTPLTYDNEYPSYHLFNSNIIKRLSPGKILINAARGGVVDNQALLTRLQEANDLWCVLDAWEGEPEVDLDLLNRVSLGTPHIAGYSLDGKLKGTEMIHAAFCEFFALEQDPSNNPFKVSKEQAPAPDPRMADTQTSVKQLNTTLLKAYNIKRDHDAMQAIQDSHDPALAFDLLRKNYPIRLEYSAGESLPVY